MRKFVFIVGFLLFSSSAFAATHIATDCTQTLVDAAFTAAEADTDAAVLVTIAGVSSPCHWTAPSTFDAPAASIGTIVRCLSVLTAKSNDNSVVILDDYASGSPLIRININSTGSFQMTGCTPAEGTGLVKPNGIFQVSGDNHDTIGLRLDHNHLDYNSATPTSPFIRFTGWLHGVVDHNTCDNTTGIQECFNVWHDGWGGYTNGDGSWADDTFLGTDKGIVFEDNDFSGAGGIMGGYMTDCFYGCRDVYRFNIFRHGTTQTHPTIKTFGRGARVEEIYLNQYLPDDGCTNTNPGYALCNTVGHWLSSGTLMFWGNTFPDVPGQSFNGYYHGISTHSDRRNSVDGTYDEAKDGNNIATNGTPDTYGYCGPARQTGTVTTVGTVVTKVTGSNFNVSWPVDGSHELTMIIINKVSYGIASVDSTSQLTLLTSAGTQPVAVTYAMGSDFDSNTDVLSGKYCLDDVGMGKGNLLTGQFQSQGGTPPYRVNTRTGTIADAQQILEPVREWLTVGNFTNNAAASSKFSNGSDNFVENETYYLDNVAGCTGSACTTGNGSGNTLPTHCTTGTGYWKLNEGSWNLLTNSFYLGQGKLYICTSTDTWTFSYEPLQYPHPLVNSGSTSGGAGSSRLHGR